MGFASFRQLLSRGYLDATVRKRFRHDDLGLFQELLHRGSRLGEAIAQRLAVDPQFRSAQRVAIATPRFEFIKAFLHRGVEVTADNLPAN